MLNNISLCGRLVQDIELKTTNTGKSVAQFTLAVERDFMVNGEKETDFIPIVVWGGTAEFASKYFSKGKLMLVNGRVQVRKYQDKDGNNRNATEVVANNIYFGGDKGESKPSVDVNPNNDPLKNFVEDNSLDGDLPF